MKKRSAIMRDQPIPPLENAIFWVEYVMRHNGAPHFRSAALDLTWYQYLMVDVIAFVVVVALVSFVGVYYILRAIFRKVFSNKKRKKD